MRKTVYFLLYIALFGGNTHAAVTRSPQSVSDSIAASATIKEVVIEGKRVIQYPDKDVWIITKDMRKNAFDTREMLGNIPGMYYDRFTQQLSYHGQKNIKILMDGKEKPGGYIENLAHLRFKHVEITPNPQGLYRDYDVLINLVTKDNYEGIEGMVNASGNYKPEQDDPISTVAPEMTFSYTRSKKINLAGQFYERITDEVRDPISVTALAIEGDDLAIFCSCDLVSTSYRLLLSVRKILSQYEGQRLGDAPNSLKMQGILIPAAY